MVLSASNMVYCGQGQKLQVMVQPISLIFTYLQNRSLIQVWLYEQENTRIEGSIVYDVYMNLILDDTEGTHSKTDRKTNGLDHAKRSYYSAPKCLQLEMTSWSQKYTEKAV